MLGILRNWLWHIVILESWGYQYFAGVEINKTIQYKANTEQLANMSHSPQTQANNCLSL